MIRYFGFSKKYPYSKLLLVTELYLGAASKKGYFIIWAKRIIMIKKYPYLAPACTDCIRCDTPIAVAASNIPGPRLWYSFFNSKSFIIDDLAEKLI